jgi:hypothetical protein
MARVAWAHHRSMQERRPLRDGSTATANPSWEEPIASDRDQPEVPIVKSIVTRFVVAVSLLATMALTLSAGLKWH